MVLAATLTLLIAAWVLHLWNIDRHIPFDSATSDGMNSLVAIRTIIEGHAFYNPDVGAPFGLHMQDFPHYWDPLIVATIWFLGLFTNDAVTVYNAIYILGFPIVAASTYLALRWIGTRRNLSVFGAVLFALLPYHFLRGQHHLILGIYWAVPLGGALAFELLRGAPLLTAREGVEGWRRWLTKRSVASALVVLACGLTFAYYAVLALILVAFVAVVRVLITGRPRAALPAVGALAVIGALTVVTTLPTIIYRQQHGDNPDVAKRAPSESERYAMRLTQVVFPIEGHRIGPLSEFTDDYLKGSPILGEGTSEVTLGAALSVSLLIAVIWLLVSGLGGRAPPAALSGIREAGVLSLMLFVLATVGGGGSIFAFLVSPTIRAWNRASIYMAFFAVIVLLALLRWAAGKVPAERLARFSPTEQALLAAAALCVIGALSILDTTSPDYAKAKTNPEITKSWRSDQSFVSQIEHSVPSRSMILQLPYSGFPEAQDREGAKDYDLFRGYVHSQNLRWSYGAMKGRATDWGRKSLVGRPLEEVLPAAAAAGFEGVYIDREYFEDDGEGTINGVRSLLGPPVVVSEDNRLFYFSLAPVRAKQARECSAAELARVKEAFLHPTDDFSRVKLSCPRSSGGE